MSDLPSELPPEPAPAAPRREVVRRPKATPSDTLDSYRDQLGNVPDDEIARLAGVSRGTVGEYRRKHGIGAYRGYLFAKGVGGPGRKADSTANAKLLSRIGDFEHLLGVEPDAAVAAKAGVTRAAVSAWRKKHGIAPLHPRTDTPPTSSKRRGRPPKVENQSKVEAFRDKVGNMADGDVAALAGVSRDAVVDYRRKHGIPAWNGFRTKPRVRNRKASPEAPAAPETRSAPAAATARAKAPSADRSFAYTVSATANGTTKDFIAVGANIETACRIARTALEARRDGPWTIDGIRVLLEALC